MRRIYYFPLLAAPLFAACGSGSTTITAPQVMSASWRQAIIQFTVPHANAVTVDVYSTPTCVSEIPDTLGNNAANRSGSVIDGVLSGGSTDGAVVDFVIGHLTDSNSLAASTQYWAQITNAGDSSQLTLQIGTAPFPTGNLYPEQPLADSTKWDNRTYPVMSQVPNFRNVNYTDPTTGLPVKWVTMPGDAWGQACGVGDGTCNPPAFDAPITSSGTWTNPGNVPITANVLNYPTPPGGTPGTCTGTCDLWLPLPTIPAQNGNSWAGGTQSAYGPSSGFDFLVPILYASCSGCTPTMTVSLTQTPTGTAYHGCTFTTAALTGSTTGYKSGADPDPGFAAFCATPPLKGDIGTSTGAVTTAGTAVTWSSGMYFQPTWTSGTRIVINSVGYLISSVNSSTSITLQSSAGTQSSPVAYASRMLGVRVQATAGAGTLSLQAEYNIGTSPQFSVNEDGGQLHCNPNPNAVTTQAGGLSYFPPDTLQGYICWVQYDTNNHGVFYLVIPRHPRVLGGDGEVRLLGTTSSFTTFTSNGATFQTRAAGSGNGEFSYAGPDPSDPNKWYVTYPYMGSVLLLSATFDVAKSNPLWQTWAGGQSYSRQSNNFSFDSPITYTNLTNPGSGQDIVTAIKTSYATLFPSFDLGGFGHVPSNDTYLNGVFTSCIAPNSSGNFANPNIEICGTFNTSGALVQVFDSWSTYPARNCAMHGPLHLNGNWHSATCDFSGSNSSVPLAGPFQLTPTAVNLGVFGSSNWTATTTLDNGSINQYGCPSLAQMQALGTPTAIANALVTLGSSGNHCIGMRFQTEPCSTTPNSAVIWAGNTKNEAQQFPCPVNSGYSMLQTIQPGDQIMDSALGQYGEGFIALTKQITSPGGVCTGGGGNCILEMYFIRGSGILPNNVRAPYSVNNTHANGWTAQVSALQMIGVAVFGAASTGTHTWIEGYFGLALSHGAADQGTSSSVANLAYVDVVNLTTFDVAGNLAQASAVFPPWGAGCEQCQSPAYPTYGGNTISYIDGNHIQLYCNGSDISNPNARRPICLRALNPGNGSGQETPACMGGGNGTTPCSSGSYTLSAVGGTNQTYTLTDPYSASATANQKLTPLVGFAGRYLLRDYSGASSVLPDSGYGMCRALVAGECVSGGVAGTTYVSVPSAVGFTQGIEGQHTQNAPAVVNASSMMCQYEDLILSGADPIGQWQRTLGQSMTGCGRQPQFNEPKILPTGDWMLGNIQYPAGFSSQVGLFRVPPLHVDSINRTGYVNIPVSTGGTSGDQVRVEFWYQEWSGVNGRAEHALAPGAGGAPFQWAFETPTYTTCSSGCTIQVPAISGHVLYYAVHRKNGGETTGLVAPPLAIP